jgi:general stress protein 26
VPRPTPAPITAEQLPELARAVLKADRFPILATVDGDQPRARPITATWCDGFTVYFANLKRFHKTEELAANAKVELCFLDKGDDQVRLTGIAERVTDRATQEEAFARDALLRQFLKSPDNPEFILYRVKPTRVRFMREWALEYFDVPF